jgi:hypothetical protein
MADTVYILHKILEYITFPIFKCRVGYFKLYYINSVIYLSSSSSFQTLYKLGMSLSNDPSIIVVGQGELVSFFFDRIGGVMVNLP